VEPGWKRINDNSGTETKKKMAENASGVRRSSRRECSIKINAPFSGALDNSPSHHRGSMQLGKELI
jgi:hypothetical protein